MEYIFHLLFFQGADSNPRLTYSASMAPDTGASHLNLGGKEHHARCLLARGNHIIVFYQQEGSAYSTSS
jgi:hypothetical protein